MEYNNIKFINLKDFRFVCYNESLKDELNHMFIYDDLLSYCLDDKEYQTYIIYYGPYNPIGYVCLKKVEKTLIVKIKIDEHFNSIHKIEDIIEDIINSLGYYNFNKKNIIIETSNKIKKESAKEVSNNKYYLFNRYNIIIPRIKQEMLSYEEYLKKQGHSWIENKQEESISWKNIICPKSEVSITFNSNGLINYRKHNRPRQKYADLNIDYSVLNNGFFIGYKTRTKEGNSKSIRIKDNIDTVEYSLDNIKIIYDRTNKLTRYVGIKTIGKEIDMFLDIVSANDDITSCIVKLCFNNLGSFITINIDKDININYIDEEDNTRIFSSHKICDEKIDLSTLQSLINKIIDELSNEYKLPIDSDLLSTQDFIISKKECITFIKQLKGEIKLPYLQSLLSKHINNINKVLVKKVD